jgi:2-methylisocitrate lyase-like PEP mutase family enzyme
MNLGSSGTVLPMLEQKCALLRSLHVPGQPLVLPNAWDAASAKAVVEGGFPVVATTSAGVAASLGYEDHQDAPAAEMLAAAARTIRSVEVPVTVDAEAGYGMSAADFVDALREIGAAGCNIEDTDHVAGALTDRAVHADRIAAIRASASARGYGLVVNARIDVFLAAGGRAEAELMDDAIERARAYLAAGADCVYPITLHGADAISSLVKAVEAPVNILALPQAPSVTDLAKLGVARVSYGSLLRRRTMGAFDEMLNGLPR